MTVVVTPLVVLVAVWPFAVAVMVAVVVTVTVPEGGSDRTVKADP